MNVTFPDGEAAGDDEYASFIAMFSRTYTKSTISFYREESNLISYLFPYVVCHFSGHRGNVRVWVIFKNTQSMPNFVVDTGRG